MDKEVVVQSMNLCFFITGNTISQRSRQFIDETNMAQWWFLKINIRRNDKILPTFLSWVIFKRFLDNLTLSYFLAILIVSKTFLPNYLDDFFRCTIFDSLFWTTEIRNRLFLYGGLGIHCPKHCGKSKNYNTNKKKKSSIV